MKMNQAQQQQTKQKKYNKNQRTRRIQYFKRKHRKSNTEEIVEQDPSLLMPLPLSSSKKTFYPLHIVSNIEPSAFLSNYSMMSTTSFKQMLLTHSSKNLYDELLDSDEKIIFTRQIFELINKLNYIKLQNEQWSYYYYLGISENIWAGRVSKKMALINSMCYTYGRQKILMEQRRKYFKQQLEEITSKLQEHLQQVPSTIDPKQLLIIANDFVDKDQYQLRVEFERRKHILQYDAKDHRSVETFYQLKPRQTEVRIHSAKIIWKAIHDEQVLRYEIAIFKNWLFCTNRSTICSFPDLALKNINDIITHLIFDKQLSSTTASANNETCSTEKFIETIAQQTISTAEAIAQQYVQTANDQKQKILHNREKFKKPPSVDIILDAIENRQINMVQRVEYNIAQQTKCLIQQNINESTQQH